MRAFAARYPNETAGVVLLDSTDPRQFTLPAYPRFYEEKGACQRQPPGRYHRPSLRLIAPSSRQHGQQYSPGSEREKDRSADHVLTSAGDDNDDQEDGKKDCGQ